MKACNLLFSLMLVASFTFSQEANLKKFKPVVAQKTASFQSDKNFVCDSPTEFAANVFTIGYDQYMLYLTWDMEYQNDEWIHWDDGNLFSGIGSGVHTSVAARWDSGFLMDYHNYKLTKMRIMLLELSFDSLIVKIWNGETESDLIYYDTIHDYYAGSWYVHELESDIYFDANKDLLVGYSLRWTGAGTFSLGTDNGEAIAGYGDLIRNDPSVEWNALSDFGLEYNWNIQFYAEDTSGNQKQVSRGSGERNINFIGYNLYQSLNGGEYELLDFIPVEIDSNYYALPMDANPDLHCYKLNALWTTPMDTCESLPATTTENPSADSVCVLLVGEQFRLPDQKNGIRCYPNPFSNEVNIEYFLSSPQSVSITFYDQFGKEVDKVEKKGKSGINSTKWIPENHSSGVYYYHLTTGNQIGQGKLLRLSER